MIFTITVKPLPTCVNLLNTEYAVKNVTNFIIGVLKSFKKCTIL